MPYKSIEDLPENVRNPLPKHAQEIYKETFNNAWDEYQERDDRETVSHKVAWSAVKKSYVKKDDKWVARE
ncbi:MAG: ChaB family protein [Gammaproteobacteria bacterium]|nr:ChaB family protein [Gammaproteobacteria bacterium]